jgi:Uma2 family endonuclease
LLDSEPEPDVAIVRGCVQDYRTSHPSTAALVIEIAISSASFDRQKAALYAEAGVEEYWIVLPAERCVEVYRRPQDGVYLDQTTVAGGAALASERISGVRVNLAEIFG